MKIILWAFISIVFLTSCMTLTRQPQGNEVGNRPADSGLIVMLGVFTNGQAGCNISVEGNPSMPGTVSLKMHPEVDYNGRAYVSNVCIDQRSGAPVACYAGWYERKGSDSSQVGNGMKYRVVIKDRSLNANIHYVDYVIDQDGNLTSWKRTDINYKVVAPNSAWFGSEALAYDCQNLKRSE